MGKKNQAVAESTNGANNGGLLFQAMEEDFELPVRTSGGEWDSHVAAIQKLAPKMVKVFESDNDQETYSKAKSLRKAKDRLKLSDDELVIAVRKHNGKHALFAQAAK